MGERITFDGHQVGDLQAGVLAVISHHLQPIIGLIRLNDTDGVPTPPETLRDAMRKAAEVIVRELSASLAKPATDVAPSEGDMFLASLTDDERRVVHNTLLAQVDDVHVCLMGWSEHEHEVAVALYERLDEKSEGTVVEAAVLRSLAYPVHEVAHLDLSAEEWAAAETVLATLAKGFGR